VAESAEAEGEVLAGFFLVEQRGHVDEAEGETQRENIRRTDTIRRNDQRAKVLTVAGSELIYEIESTRVLFDLINF
jgi:hypothetical protein